ncbi:MAG TPA: CoB--CoM heterodisulfide reductase iron-sulfur subunit B family protein [bacterium]
MTAYAYYPGCSLETMGRAYHLSAVEVARTLGVELHEVADWNCCGATAYFHIDEILAYTLCARNLALAERAGLDLVAPCAGCYKNLHTAAHKIQHDPDLAEHINEALAVEGLRTSGGVRVRHLIEVLIEDVGLERIRAQVKTPLAGLRVAPYYGCQVVRPQRTGAEAEEVHFFEDLLGAAGASVVAYPERLRCCGGSLIATQRPVALALVHEIVAGAASRGAQVIATLCPLCQINLECYQGQAREALGGPPPLPVLYFTQVLGLALGIPARRLGIGRELVPADAVIAACRRAERAATAAA